MKIVRGEALILASQSATRQALLRNAGIAIEVVAAQIDERSVQTASGLHAPAEIAAHLAREKAAEVSARYPGRLVIGADQTLALDERLFNKPAGREEAAAQLGALAGRTHQLHSAVTVLCDGQPLFEHVGLAEMTMRPLSPMQIAGYLDAAGEAVTRSVGAYQLERLGVHLFSRIVGDHFTILGLPLLPLLAFLRDDEQLAF